MYFPYSQEMKKCNNKMYIGAEVVMHNPTVFTGGISAFTHFLYLDSDSVELYIYSKALQSR